MLHEFKQRVKPRVHQVASALARRTEPLPTITLNYPPSADPSPRWGYGKPEHARIAAYLSRFEGTYRQQLLRVAHYADDLARVPLRQQQPGQPYWLSQYLPGLDAALLYATLRDLDPRRYVETGSGISTTFVAQAKRDGGLRTRITSIDPNPRAEIDALCDDVIRRPYELTTGVYDDLEAGDVVFVDNSHRVFTNSDATAFLLDALPNLPKGVRVGIHDILLPSDYLPEWSTFWFSEQYLLAAYLIAGAPFIDPVLAGGYCTTRPELLALTDPLFDRLTGDDPVDRRAFTFWFTTA
ncbi:MAG: hypothetical protein JWO22_3991 [Frankiales bacterium]|nr:hypothetical protein [Frankiales bacterium]